MHVGNKIKDSFAKIIEDSLRRYIPHEEKILGIFRATHLKTMTEAIVITDCRILSVSRDMYEGAKFKKEVLGDAISSAKVAERKWWSAGGLYSGIEITDVDGKASIYAEVLKKEEDIVAEMINAIIGNTSKKSVMEQQGVVALGNKVKQKDGVKSALSSVGNAMLDTGDFLFNRKKDVEYIVLTDTSRKRLQKKVEKYLKDGYQLEGGLSQSGGFLMSAYRYSQAVSKRR